VGLGVGAATALEGAKTVSGAGAGETGSSGASGQLQSEQGGQGERRKQRSASRTSARTSGPGTFAGAVDGHGQGPWTLVVSFLENASPQSWFQSVALTYFHIGLFAGTGDGDGVQRGSIEVAAHFRHDGHSPGRLCAGRGGGQGLAGEQSWQREP
jgi:hypothetical protein